MIAIIPVTHVSIGSGSSKRAMRLGDYSRRRQGRRMSVAGVWVRPAVADNGCVQPARLL